MWLPWAFWIPVMTSWTTSFVSCSAHLVVVGDKTKPFGVSPCLVGKCCGVVWWWVSNQTWGSSFSYMLTPLFPLTSFSLFRSVSFFLCTFSLAFSFSVPFSVSQIRSLSVSRVLPSQLIQHIPWEEYLIMRPSKIRIGPNGLAPSEEKKFTECLAPT